jgi:hypothetical protein
MITKKVFQTQVGVDVLGFPIYVEFHTKKNEKSQFFKSKIFGKMFSIITKQF